MTIYLIVPFYLYILHSKLYDKYYVGQTKDYKQRFYRHNNDEHNTFTAKYKPWTLAAVFEVGEKRNTAINLEYFIKKQKSKSLILKLIDPNFIPQGKLKELKRIEIDDC